MDSISMEDSNTTGQDRVVRSSFQLMVHGYLLPKDVGAEKFVNVSGYSVKPAFSFNDENGQVSMVARTLFLQETVSRGLLMPYVVPSFGHKSHDIKFAIECIRDALVVIKDAANSTGMKSAIIGDIVKPVFRKFN
jgi:glutamate-1-semialdehyde 2,1-aminomutase